MPKRLTKPMEELLMECHERAIMGREPLSTYYSKFAKGLVTRGYMTSMTTYTKDGRPMEVFVITTSGIKYLKDC